MTTPRKFRLAQQLFPRLHEEGLPCYEVPQLGHVPGYQCLGQEYVGPVEMPQENSVASEKRYTRDRCVDNCVQFKFVLPACGCISFGDVPNVPTCQREEEDACFNRFVEQPFNSIPPVNTYTLKTFQNSLGHFERSVGWLFSRVQRPLLAEGSGSGCQPGGVPFACRSPGFGRRIRRLH